MWGIMRGNARRIPLRDASVQCVVTSPPYWGLRDYGVAGQLGLERTPEEYVVDMVSVFREVWRVLRDDGTLWLNLGDSYYSSPSGQKGTNGTLGGGIPCAGRGTTIGRLQRPKHSCLKPKDLVGIPWRVAFALQSDGWYLRSDIIWAKPNPMPESVTDRPTKAHEYIFLLTKSEQYFYDQEAVREPAIAMKNRGGSWSENAKGDPRIRAHNHSGPAWEPNPDGRNLRTVWTLATEPYKEAHFATFPASLAERCIKAGSRAKDLVFDPFSGVGTVALVADRLGRHGIGLELKPEYCSMARARVFDDAPLFNV